MAEEPTVDKDIHAAIIAVMNEIGYVKKSRGAGLTYTYAGEAALIAALRPSMVEHGIYAAVVDMTEIVRDVYETKSGSKMNLTTTLCTIRFTHAPSCTFVEVKAMGEGADSGDKSANKAATGAYKYALRQTFCIETGDDPDKDPSVERATTKKADPKPASKAEQSKTQSDLVAYAKKKNELFNGAIIGQALQLAGINAFDPSRWDEMVCAIDHFIFE